MAQSFYPTAQTTVDAALRQVGGLDPESGITPSTAQRSTALEAFNFLVTSWQAHGMQVWCQKTTSYTMSNGVNNPTVGPSGNINIARPLSIQQAWLRDTTLAQPVDIPLEIIGREEYFEYTTKTSNGVPNTIFYDPEYDVPGSNSGASAKGRLYIYPTPDTAVATQYDLYFIYTRPIQDFSALSDTLDFPQEWFHAVKWNLAQELLAEYDVPADKRATIMLMAKNSKDEALSWDTDRASLKLRPDNEGRDE